jgi:hypothetical protein
VSPAISWAVSVVAATPLLLVAQSSNLFVERNALLLYGLIVASFVIPCAIGAAFTFRAWRWAIPTVLGVVLGDAAAIPRDLAKDTTSHNMWPIELALLAIVITVCAVAGALTGAHVSRRLRAAIVERSRGSGTERSKDLST